MTFFEHFLPEEERQKLKEAMERQEMFREEFRHSFQRLFDELDEEQLHTIKTMLYILAHTDEGDQHLAAEWLGMATWAMRTRFNICATCGVNHDKELNKEESGVVKSREPDNFNVEDHENGKTQQNGIIEFLPEFRAEMKKYHLDDRYEEQPDGWNKFIGFECTGINGAPGPCGVIYPTLADRKLKGPEECSGCFQRMMHG